MFVDKGLGVVSKTVLSRVQFPRTTGYSPRELWDRPALGGERITQTVAHLYVWASVSC